MGKKEILKEVESLFVKAEEVFDKDSAKANLFVKKARTKAMAINLKLPRELKRRFCPNCYSFLVPNKNLKVRIGGSKVIYHCSECNHIWRLGLK